MTMTDSKTPATPALTDAKGTRLLRVFCNINPQMTALVVAVAEALRPPDTMATPCSRSPPSSRSPR